MLVTMDVKLVVTKGSKKSQVIRLRSEETILGRQRGSDLRIPSPEVSRRHCRLSIRDDCVRVEDLASINGCFLNGVRVTQEEIVQPGDLLTVGPVTFRVEYALTPSAIQQLLTGAPLTAAENNDLVSALGDSEPGMKADTPQDEVAAISLKEEDAPASSDDLDPPTVDLEDLDWRAPAGEDIRDILSQLDGE
jgi:predicted component of type VI protein secretion system